MQNVKEITTTNNNNHAQFIIGINIIGCILNFIIVTLQNTKLIYFQKQVNTRLENCLSGETLKSSM